MITPAERHLTYLYLLKCLGLSESLARQVAESWYGYVRPESGLIETSFEFQGRKWATDIYSKLWWDGVRNPPDYIRNLILCDAMKDKFELEGVAGFYFDKIWRLNIDASRAAVLKPYRDADGLICGLLVYTYLNDKTPKLLTSRLLPKGTKAEPYSPERMPV